MAKVKAEDIQKIDQAEKLRSRIRTLENEISEKCIEIGDLKGRQSLTKKLLNELLEELRDAKLQLDNDDIQGDLEFEGN